jgi:hypothetical protein
MGFQCKSEVAACLGAVSGRYQGEAPTTVSGTLLENSEEAAEAFFQIAVAFVVKANRAYYLLAPISPFRHSWPKV